MTKKTALRDTATLSAIVFIVLFLGIIYSEFSMATEESVVQNALEPSDTDVFKTGDRKELLKALSREFEFDVAGMHYLDEFREIRVREATSLTGKLDVILGSVNHVVIAAPNGKIKQIMITPTDTESSATPGLESGQDTAYIGSSVRRSKSNDKHKSNNDSKLKASRDVSGEVSVSRKKSDGGSSKRVEGDTKRKEVEEITSVLQTRATQVANDSQTSGVDNYQENELGEPVGKIDTSRTGNDYAGMERMDKDSLRKEEAMKRLMSTSVRQVNALAGMLDSIESQARK